MTDDEAARLMREIVRSSAQIVRCAVRQGYFDRSLERTEKPYEFDARRRLVGFQSGLICRLVELEAEVEFWRSGAGFEWCRELKLDPSAAFNPSQD